jgi:hypothetical protein
LRLDAGEHGLSVFRVEGEGEALEVAVRFAITCRANSQHLDFVVFPSELALGLGLTVRYIPREYLDPFLNARHHEIDGLTPDLSLRLAGRSWPAPADESSACASTIYLRSVSNSAAATLS